MTSTTTLIADIQRAQVAAGERLVMDSLRGMGLAGNEQPTRSPQRLTDIDAANGRIASLVDLLADIEACGCQLPPDISTRLQAVLAEL